MIIVFVLFFFNLLSLLFFSFTLEISFSSSFFVLYLSTFFYSISYTLLLTYLSFHSLLYLYSLFLWNSQPLFFSHSSTLLLFLSHSLFLWLSHSISFILPFLFTISFHFLCSLTSFSEFFLRHNYSLCFPSSFINHKFPLFNIIVMFRINTLTRKDWLNEWTIAKQIIWNKLSITMSKMQQELKQVEILFQNIGSVTGGKSLLSVCYDNLMDRSKLRLCWEC